MENYSLLPLLFALLAVSPASKAAPAAPTVAYVAGQFVGKVANTSGNPCPDMTLALKTSGAYPEPFKRVDVAITAFAREERGQCVARFNLADLPRALFPASDERAYQGSMHRVFTLTAGTGKSDKLRMRYTCTGAAGTPCVFEQAADDGQAR